jgi:hypothetical protein
MSRERGNPLEDLTDTNDMNVLYSKYRHPYPFYHQRRLVEFGGLHMFPSDLYPKKWTPP